MAESKTPVCFGNARFTVYAPGVIRLEYNQHKQFPTTPSIVTAARLPKPCSAAVTIAGKTITVKTAALTLTYTDNGTAFTRENLSVEHPFENSRGTWHPGDADKPLVEMVRSCDVWPQHEHFVREEHTGLLDENGRKLIVDDAQMYRTRDHAWVDVTAEDRRGQDWWFFGYGRDYVGALRDFVAVFGSIPLVPRWVFGFWYSRWFEYTADDILAIAKKYRAAKLPMDVMVIDTEWREQGWNGYNWHPTRFKKYKAMMHELKSMGLIVPLNDHPGYNKPDPLPSGDATLPQLTKALGAPPRQGLWACDWSSRKCVEAWKNICLAKPFKDGMDFWWVDGWAEWPFRRLSGQFWMNLHYYDIACTATKKRGLILSRWGGWGSHRYPVQFSGDTQSTWDTLKHQIAFTADSGGAGACYWSHDIGGFHDRKIKDELYIRWIQFGAFSPVFRTHSAFGTREPFEYSPQAYAVFRQVVNQRYAMIPYYYQLAREAHETGLPLCRPMYLHYPNLRYSYTNKYQYLLGRDVLVVPGYIEGTANTRTWFVPEGTWVRPQTGEYFRGYGERTIHIPLDEIPVFYRLGSIIPHQKPGLTSQAELNDTLYLDVYPDPFTAAALDLYQDDGETNAHENNNWARTKFTCTKTTDSITVRLEQPRGALADQCRDRTVVVNVWLAPEDEIKNVTMDGKPAAKRAWHTGASYAGGACTGRATFCAVTCAPGTSEVRIMTGGPGTTA